MAYVRQRRQFGRQIGSFQAVKHRLAEAHLAVETTRTAVWSAAQLVADHDADACTAAREAVDAFRRCGGADVTAGEALAQAGAAMLANDAPAARTALAAAASASEGNCDLAPARWLTAEAERLGRAPNP